MLEGETHVGVEEETPVNVEIVEEVVGDDDDKNIEEEEPVDEPKNERLKEIVNLEDGSEDEKTLVDERTTRRSNRRSRHIEELVAATKPRKVQFGKSEGEEETGKDIPETQENQEEEEVSAEAEERRLVAERKRKEKQEAKSQTKKHKQASSTLMINKPTPEPIRVSFSKAIETPDEIREKEEEEDANQPEESVYEKTEVLVTKKLLEAMAEFDDPKKA